MFLIMDFALVLVAKVVPVALCQNTLIVHVGVEGSFYNPERISAAVNDVVAFQFEGDMHDVTQSSFESPCQPLPGGFSSGLAGRGTNLSAPAPSWNLHITNADEPIWYYCGASRPMPHCSSGMVGVINPPSINMWEQYLAAAKSTSITSTSTPSVALTGQGAFATKPPSALSSSLPNTLTSVPFPSASNTSVMSTPADTTSTSNSNDSTSHGSPQNAALIGASVGGGVGCIIIIILSLLLCRARRKAVQPAILTPYNVTSTITSIATDTPLNHTMSQKLHRSPSNPILSARAQQANMNTTSPFDLTQAYGGPTISIMGPAAEERRAVSPETGGRRVRPLPQEPRSIVRKPSNISQMCVDPDGGPVNISALAREVAAILQSPTGVGAGGAGAGGTQYHTVEDENMRPKWHQSSWHDSPGPSRDPTPAPPPGYRSPR